MAVETHDLGRFFWHTLRYPTDRPPGEHPLLDRTGVTHMIEEPWRVGRSAVVRVPGLYVALVVGWWGPKRTVEEVAAAEGTAELDDTIAVEDIRVGFNEAEHAPRPHHLYEVR